MVFTINTTAHSVNRSQDLAHCSQDATARPLRLHHFADGLSSENTDFVFSKLASFQLVTSVTDVTMILPWFVCLWDKIRKVVDGFRFDDVFFQSGMFEG